MLTGNSKLNRLENTCGLITDTENLSRMLKLLSPVKLILTFPVMVLQENIIKQRLPEESIVQRKL